MSQRILKLCVASLLNILCFPGDVDPTDGTSQKIGRNHKLAVQDGAGLGSIAKVNLELHYVLKARSY